MTISNHDRLLNIRSGLSMMDDQELFDRVATALHLQDGLDRALAGRALDQTIIFLHAAGQHPGLGLSPSPLVDTAWDRFIHYTRAYAAVCDRVAGRFIHHTPNDDPRGLPAHPGIKILTPAETAAFLRAQGYWLDEELWPDDNTITAKANCTNCYSGDHDGGQGPTP
jgi:hypothetical protein